MSYTKYCVANFGPGKTGLSSISAQIYTSATPPVTSGSAISSGSISELGTGSGVYGALVTIPDGFTGSIRWTPGDGSEAISEEINVLDNLNAMISSGVYTSAALANGPGGGTTINPTVQLVQTPLRSTPLDWNTQVVEVVTGDSLPVRVDCVDSGGEAINLTSSTVTGRLYNLAGAQIGADMTGTIIDAAGGRVSVTMTSTHTATSGVYRLNFIVSGTGTVTVGPVAVKVL
jgi:hypothetical protein